MELIHPKDLDLSPQGVARCVDLWEGLDFDDPASVEEMNRFFTSDVFQARDESSGELTRPTEVVEGSFVAFLRNVRSIADSGRRHDTMRAFIGLRDDIVNGRPLTQEDLALCRKFGLKNLAGANLSGMHVPHSLEADLGNADARDLSVDGNLSMPRVRNALRLRVMGNLMVDQARNVAAKEVGGDVDLEKVDLRVQLGKVVGGVHVGDVDTITMAEVSGDVVLGKIHNNATIEQVAGSVRAREIENVLTIEESTGSIVKIICASIVRVFKSRQVEIDHAQSNVDISDTAIATVNKADASVVMHDVSNVRVDRARDVYISGVSATCFIDEVEHNVSIYEANPGASIGITKAGGETSINRLPDWLYKRMPYLVLEIWSRVSRIY